MVPSTSLSLKLCGSYHAFNFGMSIWKKNLEIGAFTKRLETLEHSWNLQPDHRTPENPEYHRGDWRVIVGSHSVQEGWFSHVHIHFVRDVIPVPVRLPLPQSALSHSQRQRWAASRPAELTSCWLEPGGTKVIHGQQGEERTSSPELVQIFCSIRYSAYHHLRPTRRGGGGVYMYGLPDPTTS